MRFQPYAEPQRGASLMLAFRPRRTVIIGSNQLAATRALSALEADSSVVILSKGGLETACEELRWRAGNKQLEVLDLGNLPGSRPLIRDDRTLDLDATVFESYLDNQPSGSVSLVFITDTLLTSDPSTRRSKTSALQLCNVCRKRNIPVNTTDIPELCDYTVCASHRFSDPNTGSATLLQVGVTTNGQGCRLSSRLRREVVAKLPPDAGVAVAKVGRLRKLARSEIAVAGICGVDEVECELNEEATVTSPNRPVEQRSPTEETELQRSMRRMKWVAQISEYWSMSQLAALTDEDMKNLLTGDLLSPQPSASPDLANPILHSQHDLLISPLPTKTGKVLLVGSGPGHPSLLTLAAYDALTRLADVVLADKLVSAAVLSLIPSHIELRIARKFPGNADGAQQELMDLALAAARQGQTVVRLKQGDPALYGRVGEEILFLRKHGVKVLVIPGISSALAAPLFGGIPVTQRGAADSLAVATGVGRGGAKGRLPGYERARSLVLLMGNARLESLVKTLLTGDDGSFTPYPPNVPAAIIERASMPDQRIISAPLSDIIAALDSVGEQRPPGLLIVGWAVLSLSGEGDMSILDEHADTMELKKRDSERIERWLDDRRWRISEGLDPTWDVFKVPSILKSSDDR